MKKKGELRRIAEGLIEIAMKREEDGTWSPADGERDRAFGVDDGPEWLRVARERAEERQQTASMTGIGMSFPGVPKPATPVRKDKRAPYTIWRNDGSSWTEIGDSFMTLEDAKEGIRDRHPATFRGADEHNMRFKIVDRYGHMAWPKDEQP